MQRLLAQSMKPLKCQYKPRNSSSHDVGEDKKGMRGIIADCAWVKLFFQIADTVGIDHVVTTVGAGMTGKDGIAPLRW